MADKTRLHNREQFGRRRVLIFNHVFGRANVNLVMAPAPLFPFEPRSSPDGAGLDGNPPPQYENR
jgi:hypothetical protein